MSRINMDLYMSINSYNEFISRIISDVDTTNKRYSRSFIEEAKDIKIENLTSVKIDWKFNNLTNCGLDIMALLKELFYLREKFDSAIESLKKNYSNKLSTKEYHKKVCDIHDRYCWSLRIKLEDGNSIIFKNSGLKFVKMNELEDLDFINPYFDIRSHKIYLENDCIMTKTLGSTTDYDSAKKMFNDLCINSIKEEYKNYNGNLIDKPNGFYRDEEESLYIFRSKEFCCIVDEELNSIILFTMSRSEKFYNTTF